MNIFYLDHDPDVCASWHMDTHVRKMILETAQMLSTAHFVCQSGVPKLYKPTHINHPCSKWVRATKSNYAWACSLLNSLCLEYTFRWGKIHATSRLLGPLNCVPGDLPRGALTDPPQAMPDEYRLPGRPVEAYRYYYVHGKRHLAAWTRRDPPVWWQTLTPA